MNISNYKKYISAETMMGPNCVRLLGELFDKYPLQLTSDDFALDLGCGTVHTATGNTLKQLSSLILALLVYM